MHVASAHSGHKAKKGHHAATKAKPKVAAKAVK
jgi:hypothetical protein